MELKKGSVPIPVIETMDSEVGKKWAELENMSFRDLSAQSLIGAQAHQSSPRKVSQSHVDSQMYHSNPEEAKQSLTVSDTDLSCSKAAPLSNKGAPAIQTNTSEALHKEVRQNSQLFYKKGGE